MRHPVSLLVVRHCQSSGQASDAPLTAAGEAQALALSAHLEAFEVDHVVTSPYRRAVETVGPFLERSGLAAVHDARLVERTLSSQPLEDWRWHVERSFEDLDYRAPGGESAREAQQRGCEALDAVVAAGHGCALLVTHGNLMTLLLRSLDESFGFAAWESLSNPDVFRVRLAGGAATVERVWDPSAAAAP